MKAYEYIRIKLDMGLLEELNSLGSTGWHVALSQDGYVLLEREIPDHIIEHNRQIIARNRKKQFGELPQ